MACFSYVYFSNFALYAKGEKDHVRRYCRTAVASFARGGVRLVAESKARWWTHLPCAEVSMCMGETATKDGRNNGYRLVARNVKELGSKWTINLWWL